MATSPYEDDEMSTSSGRTQMNDPYEDRESFNLDRAMEEGKKISEGERVSNMPASEKTEVSKPKPAIVTKEQLAKSGYDNLRDYLNAQQGLTRRGESTPAPVKTTPSKTQPEKSQPVTPPVAKQKPAAETSVKTKSSRVPSEQEAAANRAAAMGKVKDIGSSISDYFSNFKTPAERRSQERKEKSTKSYARGGSVSSASSRGDGIAQRGKTRGRMC